MAERHQKAGSYISGEYAAVAEDIGYDRTIIGAWVEGNLGNAVLV